MTAILHCPSKIVKQFKTIEYSGVTSIENSIGLVVMRLRLGLPATLPISAFVEAPYALAINPSDLHQLPTYPDRLSFFLKTDPEPVDRSGIDIARNGGSPSLI